MLVFKVKMCKNIGYKLEFGQYLDFWFFRSQFFSFWVKYVSKSWL